MLLSLWMLILITFIWWSDDTCFTIVNHSLQFICSFAIGKWTTPAYLDLHTIQIHYSISCCELKQSYPIWSEIRSKISTIWLLLILSILHTHHGRINNHVHTITYCLAITTFQHSGSLTNLGIWCLYKTIHIIYSFDVDVPIWYTCIGICRHLISLIYHLELYRMIHIM